METWMTKHQTLPPGVRRNSEENTVYLTIFAASSWYTLSNVARVRSSNLRDIQSSQKLNQFQELFATVSTRFRNVYSQFLQRVFKHIDNATCFRFRSNQFQEFLPTVFYTFSQCLFTSFYSEFSNTSIMQSGFRFSVFHSSRLLSVVAIFIHATLLIFVDVWIQRITQQKTIWSRNHTRLCSLVLPIKPQHNKVPSPSFLLLILCFV